MNNKGKTKYLIALYSVITCVSIILILVGFRIDNSTWQAIVINLSTELLGVVLIFFLVNYLFSLEDWNLSDRIRQLLDKLESSKEPLAQAFFLTPPNLVPYINNAQQIDMCGFTLSYGLYNIGQLRHHVLSGAKLRIIVADPSSIAIKMSALRSEIPDNIEYFEERLANTIGNLEYLHTHTAISQHNHTLEIKLLPFAPNFAIYSFDRDQENAVIFIEVYPHKSGFGKQPWYRISAKQDPYWYSYFTNQFDDLWNDARPWPPPLQKDAVR